MYIFCDYVKDCSTSKNKESNFMNAKLRKFFRRTKVFFQNNAIAVIICSVTVLTIAVVGLSTYFSLNEKYLGTNTPDVNLEVNTPVSSSEPVVFVKPLNNIVISKEYSDKQLLEDKTTGIWQTHQALDFAAAEGDSVMAVYKGTIENVESSMMDGTVITLKISDNLKVVYKSLAPEALVEVGDTVQTGQEIGTAGTNITEKAEGVHVHIEVYENGKLVDPNNYFSFTDK